MLEIIETYNSMPTSGKKSDFDSVISALLDPVVQMCEQAAEAHKSKRAIHSSRRSRTSSGSAQFSPGSSATVDAILTNNSSNSSSQNSEMHSKIFLINCLSAIQQPLFGHDVASEYVKNLRSMIGKQVDALVDKEVDSILGRCGLSSKISLIQSLVNQENIDSVKELPLVEVDNMSAASLSECLQ